MLYNRHIVGPLVVGYFLCSSCAVASDLLPPVEVLQKENQIIEFDGAYLPILSKSLQLFKQTNQDIKCFTVGVDHTHSNIDVYFIPADAVEIDEDKIIMKTGGKTGCGLGMTFRFSKTGKFERRIYHR